MYALVPAPIPPAVDSKLNPHVDKYAGSQTGCHAYLHASIYTSAFSFFKDKKKGSLQPNMFGTWHVGHQDWEYPHEKVHDSTSCQASFWKTWLSWDLSFFVELYVQWVMVNFLLAFTPQMADQESAGGSSSWGNFPSSKKRSINLYESAIMSLFTLKHIVFWKKSSQLFEKCIAWKRVNSTGWSSMVLYHIIMCFCVFSGFRCLLLLIKSLAPGCSTQLAIYFNQNWSSVKFRHGFHTDSLQSIVLLLKLF